MITKKNVWLNARKYKPTDVEGYRCGDFLALRIEYPRYHEFDVVAGWYNTVRNRFEIPEKYPNHKHYIIKAFCVLPDYEEKNYTDKLEKKIDFLTDILTEEQLDQYIKWCEENGI